MTKSTNTIPSRGKHPLGWRLLNRMYRRVSVLMIAVKTRVVLLVPAVSCHLNLIIMREKSEMMALYSLQLSDVHLFRQFVHQRDIGYVNCVVRVVRGAWRV